MIVSMIVLMMYDDVRIKIDNFIKKLLKSYLQLIRLKKEKTIHSKTLFTISVDLKST